MNYVSQGVVIDVVDLNQWVREYSIKLDQARKYPPGSFVQLTLELVNASQIWPESRTFSIASYQYDVFKLIIKRVGFYTEKIFSELKIGSRCTIKYPFGNLFDKRTLNDRHVMIAGGLGITPFFSLLDYFKQEEKLQNAYLIYSVKHISDAIHINELRSILQDRFIVHVTREQQDDFINRRIGLRDITDHLTSENDQIYICGSKDFNSTISRQLNDCGLRKIHMDEWE